MEKYRAETSSVREGRRKSLFIVLWRPISVILIVCLLGLYHSPPSILLSAGPCRRAKQFRFGTFPKPGDPFKFLPCTNTSVPPALNDTKPAKTWAKLFDPDPEHWSWGNKTNYSDGQTVNGYEKRGIYLCGYLDVPMDYTNKSDARIVRLAITKFQVSGLAHVKSTEKSAGKKSERTLIIEPGGPGGSGTSYAWRAAEEMTERVSDGQYDVLGWDPRGVNISLPAVSCFPHDADRDRWRLLAGQYREVSASPRAQLELADAMNDAVMHACHERHGDFGRFVSTTFVARDMEEIRKALDEDELTGFLVSYGTGIGQTYANMFPDSVGRMVLDGTEYVRDHRLLGGFGWTALDNATDAWHDGVLGECLKAGPEHCALAKTKAKGEKSISLHSLKAHVETLVDSLIANPIVGYTAETGPSLILYSTMVSAIYSAMYSPPSWTALAQMLYELDNGNSTLAAAFLEHRWEYDPTLPSAPTRKPSSDELGYLVICSDSYDAPTPPGGLDWWESLWKNMTAQNWIAGNSRFHTVLPCRHFNKYWDAPAEVYRGDLNNTLRHPILLIAETYDPATPLRNGRRLLAEMGKNARMVVHHGYGHSSGRDRSNCTDAIAKNYILHGILPDEQETACFANEKPYLYQADSMRVDKQDHIAMWRQYGKKQF
ncbi:alpha/beta-hydrolase [Microthyrium microscopicum]|uniref:Alpha/beta-hydrolase n=1 Tax=Microthyrium microscopicum TaxID=703497 RepID=A0A6A6U513_9PEZI|nr:alpha/beta-hydrolase [Microthyrium microscopicum]